MKRVIGIKSINTNTIESIGSLECNEQKLAKIKSLAKAFNSYDSFKDNFKLAVDWNMLSKKGSKIKNIDIKNKGMFTEFIISL